MVFPLPSTLMSIQSREIETYSIKTKIHINDASRDLNAVEFNVIVCRWIFLW